jgi:hypothetical protein
MIYAGSKTSLVNEVSLTKVSNFFFSIISVGGTLFCVLHKTFELREVQDFTEDWLAEQLARH